MEALVPLFQKWIEQLDRDQQGNGKLEKHIKQVFVTDGYRTLYPTTIEYTLWNSLQDIPYIRPQNNFQ